LWRVAIEMVEPATNRFQHGERASLHGTADVDRDATRRVVCCSAGYLKAMAQRGNLLVEPEGARPRRAVDSSRPRHRFRKSRRGGLGPLAAEGDHVLDGGAAPSASRRRQAQARSCSTSAVCVAGRGR
jgi:hypothetical protein